MKSRGNLTEMKRIAFLIVFLSIGTSGYSKNAAQPPLKLTIAADKESYSIGEEIKINYAIENVSEEPVGFYEFGCDGMKTAVTDLADKPYPYIGNYPYIKNVKEEAEEEVGFYVYGSGDMKTVISDLADKPYPYYYDKSMNRWVTSYPREYVFLKPHRSEEHTSELQSQR